MSATLARLVLSAVELAVALALCGLAHCYEAILVADDQLFGVRGVLAQ